MTPLFARSSSTSREAQGEPMVQPHAHLKVERGKHLAVVRITARHAWDLGRVLIVEAVAYTERERVDRSRGLKLARVRSLGWCTPVPFPRHHQISCGVGGVGQCWGGRVVQESAILRSVPRRFRRFRRPKEVP